MDSNLQSALLQVLAALNQATIRITEALTADTPASSAVGDTTTRRNTIPSLLTRQEKIQEGREMQEESVTEQALAGVRKQLGRRGSFNVTKEELSKLREIHTGKEIAAKFGVSPVTVANRAKALGLTKPRTKGKAKK